MKPTFKKLLTAGVLASAIAFGPSTSNIALAVADELVSPEILQSADSHGAGTPAHLLALNAELKNRWGVEIVSLRRTAHGHMLDFRYRVLDPEKATALFERQTKPTLIHQPTGKVLAVPKTAKVGPLRSSDTPKEGRTYWTFFGNAGGLVKTGDKVTVAIGDFRAPNLIVE